MLLHCSLLVWAVIQLIIPGSQTNQQPCPGPDPILCRHFGPEKCKETDVRKMCINLCTDHRLCKHINRDECKNAAVREDCPQTCSECSEAKGFFKVAESGNQCFKFFPDSAITWHASKLVCQAEGLELAYPDNPVVVRKVMVDTFGIDNRVWLGAQGTGSSEDGSGNVKWIRDGTTLSTSNSAWLPGWPNIFKANNNCLILQAIKNNLNTQPTRPYIMARCLEKAYALCELVQ